MTDERRLAVGRSDRLSSTRMENNPKSVAGRGPDGLVPQLAEQIDHCTECGAPVFYKPRQSDDATQTRLVHARDEVVDENSPALVHESAGADFVDRGRQPSGTQPTREGLRQFMCVYIRAFPDDSITVDQLVEGDRVVTHWHGTTGQAGSEPSRTGHTEPLTGREEEVRQLLIRGVTTTHDLAASLVVTDNTVKYHLRNILDKLNLHNRTEVVALATRYWRAH